MLSAKQVYPGRYEPEVLLKLLLTEGVTLSHCVPTILTMLVNSPVVKQVDLSRWKVIIGGSALTKGLAKAALDLGIQVYQGYGMSETAPIMTLTQLNDSERPLPIDEQVDYRTRKGRVAPFVDIRLMDDEGNFVPHDGHSLGEVVTRGHWMTQGYYEDPERSTDLWKGGWLHTGDVASMTPDYWLLIADRTKDVIKTGGEWVSSLDIENLISQLDGVGEVAVVGLPDDDLGQRVAAFVVTEGPARAGLADELVDLVATRLSWHKRPRQIVFVDRLPRNAMGKVQKTQLG